ncbi:hypothetical protein LEP1GSC166_1848 [Leptospira kirschneri]|uniref:hypothetical protein n=1 Tax=Leptospira kirschneri TaxID=29507 RepID=UPI0002BF3D94|nr:hypothetical protein [Leptospira kirschneri]EMK02818.1 hypothetical protein LEP1GSC166_1848 [Leptospira kirschneri]
MDLVFTTLTTGQSEFSSREDIGDDAIEFLKPLVKSKTFDIPIGKGYVCVIDSTDEYSVYDIKYKDQILIRCGFCMHESASEKLWEELSEFNKAEFGAPPRASIPGQTPWLGVIPGIALVAHFSMLTWVADFERCVAWTIYEIKNNCK